MYVDVIFYEYGVKNKTIIIKTDCSNYEMHESITIRCLFNKEQ